MKNRCSPIHYKRVSKNAYAAWDILLPQPGFYNRPGAFFVASIVHKLESTPETEVARVSKELKCSLNTYAISPMKSVLRNICLSISFSVVRLLNVRKESDPLGQIHRVIAILRRAFLQLRS